MTDYKALREAFVTGWDERERHGPLAEHADGHLIALGRYPAPPASRAPEDRQPARAEPAKLRWYLWTCINGHSNDHAKLAPDGTKMCATPGCQAEAECAEPPKEPAPEPKETSKRDETGGWIDTTEREPRFYTEKDIVRGF